MMDARIGQLMRSGAIVHYAYVNGYGAEPVEGTLEQVEIALGLRAAPVTPTPIKPVRKAGTKRAPAYRDYIVHITKKYPAWYEVGGFDHRVSATSAKAAISQARKDMARDCMFDRFDGAITYTVRRAG